MPLFIPAASSDFHPDVMPVCEGEPPKGCHETSPCPLVEVLSGSTAHNDHRYKYPVYRAIPRLQTYLILSQEERYIVEYQSGPENGSEEWSIREHRDGGQVDMPRLGRSRTLDEIYWSVR